ncbi:MAG: FAD-dependent oxidoreductase [Clostridia bacterium]|nr:FAD-dependent oxidoreductase [Clostridia bacterium]
MKQADLVIIGGGPAGMAAAVAARQAGLTDILILERDSSLGGILQQCIHNGFGLHRFGEELTGPEYAARYEVEVEALGIPYQLNTTVTGITADRVVTAINSEEGVFSIQAGAIVLAMGCRERSRGALNIPGTRPAGVYSAGAAQKFVNMKGYLPGRRVVILGSGDIGLIMARRMTLEGAKVLAVCEVMPYSGGLQRNIQQCLKDFDIPLYLSHTVTAIHGTDRVTGVTVAKVDECRRPIPGSERDFDCDTLLLSVGLIPENELTKGAGIPLDAVTGGAAVDESRQTAIPGIFACGNVLHVHDLVDYVSEEAALAGRAAATYVVQQTDGGQPRQILPSGMVRYTVPQTLHCADRDVTVYFRVAAPCTGATVTATCGDKVFFKKKKAKMAPGEMEQVTLKATDLAACTGDITLCVEV